MNKSISNNEARDSTLANSAMLEEVECDDMHETSNLQKILNNNASILSTQ